MYPIKYYIKHDQSPLRSIRGRCFKNTLIVCGFLRIKKTKDSPKPKCKTVTIPLNIIATIADLYGRKTHAIMNEQMYIQKCLVYVADITLPVWIRPNPGQVIPLKLFYLSMDSIRKFIIYHLHYPECVWDILEFHLRRNNPRMIWFINDIKLLMETDKGLEIFSMDYFEDMIAYKIGYEQFDCFWKHINSETK